MKAYRSFIFVPGHKADWVGKAVSAGADAVIIDLEDSVPDQAKAEARAFAARNIDEYADSSIGLFVRPNAIDTNEFGRDLAAVVRPGLDGLLVPKPNNARDINRLDGVTTCYEIENDMPRGTVEFILSLETAASLAALPELTVSSPRVSALQAATARDGDISRELGYQWTAEGFETLAYRSQVVVTSRANELSHPLCGVWQELEDLVGLRAFAEANRRLGFRGQLVLHPTHIPIVNEVYAIGDAELDRAQRMITTYEDAMARGDSAVRFEGDHIDTAHAKTARALIELGAHQRGEQN